jgi:hypothetical protein
MVAPNWLPLENIAAEHREKREKLHNGLHHVLFRELCATLEAKPPQWRTPKHPARVQKYIENEFSLARYLRFPFHAGFQLRSLHIEIQRVAFSNN